MTPRYQFNRLEFAGSLGDLGTLLPIAIGMILINGLNAAGVFFSIGLFYIFSGIYYGITVPVQPMKVIGAYAIVMAMNASQIYAAGLLMGLLLLLIGATGAITFISRYVPKPVVRGVQLSTGALLMSQGVRFMLGTSKFQLLQKAAEPFLSIQNIGPLPAGIMFGAAGGALALLLLENRKLPAGLVLVAGGVFIGLILGTREGLDNLKLGIYFPEFIPSGVPAAADFAFAFFVLVLPQTPMTIGNAVIANADLSREYFGEDSKKMTERSLCISMALANFLSFLVGGMPVCHGAGGLAAHYRFGARTAGSNLMIGAIFTALAILLGTGALSLIYLIPLSILGVLLLFAGSQLAITIIDLKTRKELFVAIVMLGITLAANLAVGFIAGIAIAYALKSDRLSV
ncbi:putative sulfate/molybdate transporter [Thermodesulfobacteriota bacterium]